MFQIIWLILALSFVVAFCWLLEFKRKKAEEYKSDERWQLVEAVFANGQKAIFSLDYVFSPLGW